MISIHLRNLEISEAEKIANYLCKLVHKFKFENVGAFDENTSHIIGKEWQEIDYSGEGMTWRKQRQQYLPYGIKDFKSLKSIERFFPVESKLPYFNKIYRPQKRDSFE